MIIDTHVHLNDEALLNNIDEIIKNAKEQGVEIFVVPGWDKESSFLSLKLSHEHKEIYSFIGFHPSNVKDIKNDDFEKVFALIPDSKIIGIGEIGLDYYWEKDIKEREKQKEYFIKQIDMANKLKLPIAIHNRDAIQDTLDILKEHKPLYGGVLHCFTYSKEMMKEFVKLGLYISFGGVLTFKNAVQVKESAKEVPLDRILVETDAPYLAPHPYRGKMNEPKYITYVIDALAEIKNMSKNEIIKITNENAKRLFKI